MLDNNSKEISIATDRHKNLLENGFLGFLGFHSNSLELTKDEYKLELKHSGKEGDKRLYKVKNPHPDNPQYEWDNELKEFFREPITLSRLAKILQDEFNCLLELSNLDRIDLGTTNIDISLGKDKISMITGFHQQQAPSDRKDIISSYKKEIKALEDERNNHINKLKILNEAIVEKDKEIKSLRTELDNTKKVLKDTEDYKKIVQSFDKRGDNDIESFKAEAKTKAVIREMSDIIRGNYRDKLKPFADFNPLRYEEIFKIFDSIINSIIIKLNKEEVNKAFNEDDISRNLIKEQSFFKEVEEKVKQEATEYILFVLSPPQVRMVGKAESFIDSVKIFDLELFKFNPGDRLDANRARFVETSLSEHERGLCVSTISYGIRNCKTDRVIYKADVIIGR